MRNIRRFQTTASRPATCWNNDYGATTPGEFFAVVSECFFTDPETLQHLSAAVYDQLVLLYGQNVAHRHAHTKQ